MECTEVPSRLDLMRDAYEAASYKRKYIKFLTSL